MFMALTFLHNVSYVVNGSITCNKIFIKFDMLYNKFSILQTKNGMWYVCFYIHSFIHLFGSFFSITFF